MSRFLIDSYGYNPGAYQNYSVKTPGYKLMARVDWNINRNHALNVRFSRTQNKYSSAPSSSISPLNAKYAYDKDNYGRTSIYAMYFGNSRYYQEQNFTSVAAELNSRFMDSRLTNTLRYTYSHQYEPRSYDGGIFPTVDILEATESGTSALYASFGLDPFTEGNLREVSTHIVTDEIGYTLGKHRLVAGLQFEHNLTTNGYLQGGAGYYVYESWDDFKNDKAPLAFRIAHGNNDALSQAFPQFSHMQYSVYFQDEINVSERFKATVGLRFEVPVYPSISGNENKDFTEIFAEHGGYKTSDMPKARLSVAPPRRLQLGHDRRAQVYPPRRYGRIQRPPALRMARIGGRKQQHHPERTDALQRRQRADKTHAVVPHQCQRHAGRRIQGNLRRT